MKAIESGWIQRLMARQAYEQERAIQSGARVIVGLNKYRIEEDISQYEQEMHVVDPATQQKQIDKLNQVKRERDNGQVMVALQRLTGAIRSGENVLPAVIECVKAYATLGEIVAAMKETYGVYKEPSILD